MNMYSKREMKSLLKLVTPETPLIVKKSGMIPSSHWNNIRSIVVPAHHFSGKISGSKDIRHFHYLGWDRKLMIYWLREVFEEFDPVALPKYIPCWRIGNFLKNPRHQCDIVLMEQSMFFFAEKVKTPVLSHNVA